MEEGLGGGVHLKRIAVYWALMQVSSLLIDNSMSAKIWMRSFYRRETFPPIVRRFLL